MGRQRFEERKEILIRELSVGFVGAFLKFKDLYRNYKDKGKLSYSAWDEWVGTETRKGPLWRLADLSLSVFRRPGSRLSMHEVLLDWSLVALFHESLKIREDVYQLSHPLEWSEGWQYTKVPEIRATIEQWERHLAQVRGSIRGGLEEVHQLFQSGWTGLKGTLLTYRELGLVMRCLTENRNLLVDLLGDKEWGEFMEGLHPHGEADAWYLAGMSYYRSGWFDKANMAFEKALNLLPEHPMASKMLKTAEASDSS